MSNTAKIRSTQDALNDSPIADSLFDLMMFLVWAREDDAVFGNVKADDALKSLHSLSGFSTEQFDKLITIMLGDFSDA